MPTLRNPYYDFAHGAPSNRIEPFSLSFPENPGDGTIGGPWGGWDGSGWTGGLGGGPVLFKGSKTVPVGDGELTYSLSGSLVLSAGDLSISIPNLPLPYDIQVENSLSYAYVVDSGWTVEAKLADKVGAFSGDHYVEGSLSATTPINFDLHFQWIGLPDLHVGVEVGAQVMGSANCKNGDGDFGVGPLIRLGGF